MSSCEYLYESKELKIESICLGAETGSCAHQVHVNGEMKRWGALKIHLWFKENKITLPEHFNKTIRDYNKERWRLQNTFIYEDSDIKISKYCRCSKSEHGQPICCHYVTFSDSMKTIDESHRKRFVIKVIDTPTRRMYIRSQTPGPVLLDTIRIVQIFKQLGKTLPEHYSCFDYKKYLDDCLTVLVGKINGNIIKETTEIGDATIILETKETVEFKVIEEMNLNTQS